jgi:hypothetical protein
MKPDTVNDRVLDCVVLLVSDDVIDVPSEMVEPPLLFVTLMSRNRLKWVGPTFIQTESERQTSFTASGIIPV